MTSTGSAAARRAASASGVDEATRDRLYARAAVLGINGRSRMTKEALRRAIEAHERGAS